MAFTEWKFFFRISWLVVVYAWKLNLSFCEISKRQKATQLNSRLSYCLFLYYQRILHKHNTACWPNFISRLTLFHIICFLFSLESSVVFIKSTATAAVMISAVGNVSQTTQAFDKSDVISCDNPHATGRIRMSWRSRDIISEETPLPCAWNTPCSDKLIPAKKEPKDMILVALTQSACVLPDKPKAAHNGSAMISKRIVPNSMIAEV